MRELIEQLPLIERELEKSGVSLDADAGLLWAAAVGATQRMWRNTTLEDWHAGSSGLPDGEMMRANAATVRLAHELLASESPWEVVAAAVTDPERRLPDGRALVECVDLDLADLRLSAEVAGELLAEVEANAGRRAARVLAACPTLWSGGDWHGMPTWPRRVNEFCRAVQHPEDSHWSVQALEDVGPRPKEISDIDELRRVLLAGPDRMTAEAADWCVRAGIRHVRLDR
ncbi:hypothetical protein [Fodinibacter luteus]|uniref:hypothetical protein n=1 Tax=Fodinibacter luteus TaxID=552064 RepID=UPI0031E5D61D